MIGSFQDLLGKAISSGPAVLAVAPLSEISVREALKARDLGLAAPLLVGDIERYRGLLKGSIRPEHLIGEEDPDLAVRKAAELLGTGRADILMQGDGDPRSFVGTLLHGNGGPLLKGPASYVSLFPLKKSSRLILLTDTLVHSSPTLEDKRRILENALFVASALEIPSPRVALLAAIEQVNPNIPSTLDAAVLSKMAERGQFGNAVAEGPLDIDCALSERAASRKGVRSPVTGNVDIYLLPDLESGYALSELLVFIGAMPMAGVLVSGLRPVLPLHPAVSGEMRIVQIALAVLVNAKRKHDEG